MSSPPTSSAPPLRVTQLHKRYGKHRVLEGVELEVPAGQAVALVGPNGTGKSTLIGAVVGAVIPDEGRIEIAGHDLRAAPIPARAALRYLPQEVDAPLGVTGRELLEIFADIYGDRSQLARSESLADLGPAVEHLVTTYSVGMRKRLAFAALAAGPARLLVLDEPFAGIDAEGRARFTEWLRGQLARGAGVLLAAHDSDATELDRLGARRFSLAQTRTPEASPGGDTREAP